MSRTGSRIETRPRGGRTSSHPLARMPSFWEETPLEIATCWIPKSRVVALLRIVESLVRVASHNTSVRPAHIKHGIACKIASRAAARIAIHNRVFKQSRTVLHGHNLEWRPHTPVPKTREPCQLLTVFCAIGVRITPKRRVIATRRSRRGECLEGPLAAAGSVSTIRYIGYPITNKIPWGIAERPAFDRNRSPASAVCHGRTSPPQRRERQKATENELKQP